MAQFTPEELDTISLRGFQPADGYDGLNFRRSANVSYPNFITEQTADGVPYQIIPLGSLASVLNGGLVGFDQLCWMSEVDAPATSTPPNAAGIRIVGGSHVEDGRTVADFTIYFVDRDGNNLANPFFINTYPIYNQSTTLLHSGSIPTYLTLCYRTDVSTPYMAFGLKYNIWYQDSFQVDHIATDKAVLLGTQSIGNPNLPFLDWYNVNKNSSWYDKESGEPELYPGGGGGSFYRPSDSEGLPSPPAFDICNSEFLRLYNLTAAELTSLGNFLWDPSFAAAIAKNWADPFQNIIALFTTPLTSDELDTASAAIQIGNVSTALTGAVLQSSWIRKDFGAINVNEIYKGFEDYLTKVTIRLPYIGKRDLEIDSVMKATIHLYYDIDILSGNCIAHLLGSKNGRQFVIDSYQGNVNNNIPITGTNYMAAYQAAFNGLATAAGAAIGQNPLGAAQAAAGFASIKPGYEKSGTYTGAYGRLCPQQPALFFETPLYKTGENFRKLNGYIANTYVKLGDCKDYTRVKYIDLTGINAPESVKDRILEKLKAGVHIHAA